MGLARSYASESGGETMRPSVRILRPDAGSLRSNGFQNLRDGLHDLHELLVREACVHE